MAFSVEAEVASAVKSFRWNEAELTRLLAGPRGPLAADLARRAIRVESAAKGYASGQGGGPNVRTGRLRGSITWRLGSDAGGLYADVGSAVHYCIFGGHTRITTATGGYRALCQLRPGDRVLTQTGGFQRVTAITWFPAVEKPDLVDLIIPWRADRDHRLTLTLDHRVLCRRDGRNQWVAAGDLRGGDLLYDRVKISHNKDSGPLKTCEWCQRRHRGQGRRYCSQRCRDEAWAAGRNPHLGAVRSEVTRAKLKAKAVERRAGLVLNRRLAERGFQTSHEREVAEWLDSRGVVYLPQAPIGEHVVDFFIPETREIIEADGAYWHQDQARDIERDRELLAAAAGTEITHIHFHDRRFSPETIDSEPLPGVRYVVCNPGIASFVEPSTFRPRPVRVERIWRYGQHLKPHASARARLYDIAVENIESFVAGGAIVSNSAFVELGTSRMSARPYLRPALPAAK